MSRIAAFLASVLLLLGSISSATAASASAQAGASVIHSAKNDVSARLSSLTDKDQGKVKDKKERKQRGFPQIATGAADTAVQSSAPGAAAPAASSSFEGIGQGLPGFTVQYAPPDTNGAVGPNHFVQTVNVSFAVFSKTGGLLYGAVAINTLFTGFGGLCEADNDGDPSVVYDQLADRWVITQFAVTGANGTSVPYLECLAVSTSGDPTGTYYRYSFPLSRFPDYPKLGVWPDAYYMSTNDFNGNTFAGATTWAFDRAKMLAGLPATAQTFHLSTAYGGLLPSSLDGKTQPPAGSPNYFVSLGTSASLYLWKFHADFANPANSTLVGPSSIGVAGFTELCGGGTCIPQAGTTQRLDSLADRLMYRLAYRNFGDHEALVVTHSVAPGAGGGGVRWYEIRNPGGTPSVYQQSTYAPDTQYRWMASAAMDRAGDIGVGYSLSSSTMNPAIAYSGRLASDPLNTLQAQTILISGTGSQVSNLSRWGDYSSMVVDPVDDCTFWYTTEYLTANGTWNWHTRIGTFKFPTCTTGSPAPTVTSISPVSGSSAGGTAVTVTGAGFQAGATASIGGLALTGVNVVNATTITGTTQAHAAGIVDVVVTNPDAQTGACAGCFKYDPAAAPTVASISPPNGSSAGGTAVTVTGAGFQAGATASIGGLALTGVSWVDATTITGTTRAHAAGIVDVVVTNPDAQTGACAGCFTYADTAPVISSVSATSNRTSANITWTTNVPADSQVEYGRTSRYGLSSPRDTRLVTGHSVNLTGLSRRTTYHYRVYSRNGAGILAISADFTFRTH